MVYFGKLWYILVYFGILWYNLEYFSPITELIAESMTEKHIISRRKNDTPLNQFIQMFRSTTAYMVTILIGNSFFSQIVFRFSISLVIEL